MKKLSAILLVSFLISLVVSCSIEPSKMAYGSDACHFCKMTIVDQQHAAQIVTKKGKSYKYDAIECMANHLKDFDTQKVSLFLVNDFDNPGVLIPASEASYLISPQIKSPMGANLTAFKSLQKANTLVKSEKDELLDWSELLSSYKVH